MLTPQPAYESNLPHAKARDRKDPLKKYHDRFHFPMQKRKPFLYFAGHSLGLMPRKARAYINEELDSWAKRAVEGHHKGTHPWLPYHELLTESTARLVGARADEVVVMNSLTVNLHLMLVSFYRPTKARYKILMEANPFPSDLYAAKSQARFHGFGIDAIVLLPENPTTREIQETIHQHRDSLALVLLGNVNFLTGQAFDMKTITKAAHEAGALAGFNLAHGAGNLVLNLHDSGADFAVWCSYKYLNAGPGSIAGAFVHQNHLGKRDIPRLEGWWGQNKKTRFQMGPDFDPIPTVEAWQLSNPPIFQLAALRASLDIFDSAGMSALAAKRDALTGYLEFLLKKECDRSCTIITPRDRGTQLSVRMKSKHSTRDFEGMLRKHGAICDFREPDILRIAPAPLYTRFEDVFHLVELIEKLA
jgi:kynureninase